MAKAVLEMQVTRLGLSGPDWPLPISLRSTLHELWADNGDVISRQYAGTNALKVIWTMVIVLGSTDIYEKFTC